MDKHEPPDPRASHNSAQFYASIPHAYRAEMNRMTVWRQRLDITSNWAIILATGLTTFTLGSAEVPHYTLLLGLALIGISILLEGRRYRHLHHSKWRLYLFEAGYFSELLRPPLHEDRLPDWRTLLASDFRHTHFGIDWFTAIRVRLRRNYLLILYFITAVWIVKLMIHPERVTNVQQFWQHLHIGNFIPSWFVAITAGIFVIGSTVLAVTCPSAEHLEDWSRHYALVRARKRRSDDDA